MTFKLRQIIQSAKSTVGIRNPHCIQFFFDIQPFFNGRNETKYGPLFILNSIWWYLFYDLIIQLHPYSKVCALRKGAQGRRCFYCWAWSILSNIKHRTVQCCTCYGTKAFIYVISYLVNPLCVDWEVWSTLHRPLCPVFKWQNDFWPFVNRTIQQSAMF